MMGRIQERCQIEMIFDMQLAHSLYSNVQKEGIIPVSRKTNENDNVPSMKRYDQILNDKVGIIGKFMDCRHHLHLQQSGDNHKNDKNHKNDMNDKDSKNDMDDENGKNKCSDL